MYPGYPDVSAGYIRGIRRHPDRTKKNLHQISHRLMCLIFYLDGVRIFVPYTYPGFSHTLKIIINRFSLIKISMESMKEF